MAELRELLWPGGKLLSASEGSGTRTEAEKAATLKEVLTMLVDSMPGMYDAGDESIAVVESITCS